MGILILFVLSVGAGTIVYFVWKFVAGIFKADAIKQDMAAVAEHRSLSIADHSDSGALWKMDGKVRFQGGEQWFMGIKIT